MSSIPLHSPGCVYLMTSSVLQKEGILKIGSTTDHPDERAKQLTASTASPTPFIVLYSRTVSDCNDVEAKMHSAFAHCRVNQGREFFRVSLYEAARMLDILAGSIFSSFEPKTPYAELFATFPDDTGGRALTEDERYACLQLKRKLEYEEERRFVGTQSE